jgi:hypothetical protein
MQKMFYEEMNDIMGPVTCGIFRDAGLNIEYVLPSFETCQKDLETTIDKNDKWSPKAKRVKLARCMTALYQIFYPHSQPLVPWFYECSVCGQWLDDAVTAPDGNAICRVCIVEYVDEHIEHAHSDPVDATKFRSLTAMNQAVMKSYSLPRVITI